MLIHHPDHDIPLAHLLGEKLGINRRWERCRSFAVVRNKVLTAIVVYSEYRHPNIEASIWSCTPRWATPPVLRALLQYPFLQLGVSRITATTEDTNQPAREFLCRLGFRHEGTHPDALPTGTAVTYGLLRKDAARWLVEDWPLGKRRRGCSGDPGPECDGAGAVGGERQHGGRAGSP